MGVAVVVIVVVVFVLFYSKLSELSSLCYQVMKLRQAKNELERKVQDQEEELDEQAGTIQQLEQVLVLCFALR